MLVVGVTVRVVCVYVHTAPTPKLSFPPPSMAIEPSAEIATPVPWLGWPAPSLATILLPRCVQIPPLRVNAQTAPTLLLSGGPPMSASLPSADIASVVLWFDTPTPPEPTSLLPC